MLFSWIRGNPKDSSEKGTRESFTLKGGEGQLGIIGDREEAGMSTSAGAPVLKNKSPVLKKKSAVLCFFLNVNENHD